MFFIYFPVEDKRTYDLSIAQLKEIQSNAILRFPFIRLLFYEKDASFVFVMLRSDRYTKNYFRFATSPLAKWKSPWQSALRAWRFSDPATT